MSFGALHSIGDYYGWQTSNEHRFGNAFSIILQMVEHAQGKNGFDQRLFNDER